MTEFGIFNDEGLLEGGFYSRVMAETRLEAFYGQDDAHVAEICPDHPGRERETCEECNS